MNAPRPANVAYVDAEMVYAAATLDDMVESYRRGSVEFNVDPAARYLLMSRATVDTYDHFEVAKLLAVAVARLGDLPAPPPAVVSGDLFAVDVVPADPHAVAAVVGSGEEYIAVCVCSTAFRGPQDDAVEALDRHIANPDRVKFRSANGMEWWQTQGGLFIRVPSGLDVLGALAEGYDPYPRQEIEAEYGPLVEVTA